MEAEPRAPGDAKLAFVALLVLASIASFIDNGVIGWIVAPICIVLAWFAMFRSPLRSTMLTLMFFALVLENPSEGPASGLWESPWAPAAGLVLVHFKSRIGGWMFFGGMDLMLLGAIVVYFVRGKSATRGPLGTPKPLIRLAQLSYATILLTFVIGKWRGGDSSFAVWQIDRVIYLPTVFLLCQAAFTGTKDYLAVGKVALGAALLRATQAIYVRLTVDADIDPITGESTLPYATTHNDSILFAVAFFILVAIMLQRRGSRNSGLVLTCMPILIGGMLANDRRIVWVEIIMVFLVAYFLTEANAIKRKLNRLALVLVPLVAVYVGVGWGSTAGVFKPVQVIRSAVDSSADTSTAWRDLENFNLVFTTRQFPLMGVGYGHGFWEMWPMPFVPYELEKYIPHNSILGLYCYGGVVGYAGITALWVGGVYFAIRAYYKCQQPLEKAAGLTAMGAVLVYYLQCFGDMGLGSWTGVFLVAPSLAIAGKLAVSSGAWELTAPKRRAARSVAPGPSAARPGT